MTKSIKFTPAMIKKGCEYLDKSNEQQIKEAGRGAKSIMKYGVPKI